MRVGARNRIVGKVTEIEKGKLMCLVKLDIPAKSTMGSVMTRESLNLMSLGSTLGEVKEGAKVFHFCPLIQVRV